MWAVRAGLQFFVLVAVAAAIGLVLAAVWAVWRGGGYWDALFTGCLVFGMFLIALGAAGQSPSERTLGTGGRLPGMRAFGQPNPGDISVRPGVLLILAGVVLLVIGALGHG